ncbi:hypothetical protein J4E89_003001 [Alternaria sp. Ai002NY15]|nr:hypothetical protein J4E89_003001 [Alternaria sp. Ai002NY15]
MCEKGPCWLCKETHPYLLRFKLDAMKTDKKIDEETYNEWYTLIESLWSPETPNAKGKYACASRHVRFREPSKDIIENLEAVTFIKSLTTARQFEAPLPDLMQCHVVDGPREICGTCQVAVLEGRGLPEEASRKALRKLFKENSNCKILDDDFYNKWAA